MPLEFVEFSLLRCALGFSFKSCIIVVQMMKPRYALWQGKGANESRLMGREIVDDK